MIFLHYILCDFGSLRKPLISVEDVQLLLHERRLSAVFHAYVTLLLCVFFDEDP